MGKEFRAEGMACAKALWEEGTYLNNLKEGKGGWQALLGIVFFY